MSRYTAPLGFTLVAIWVAVIFAIVAGQATPQNSHRATQSTQTQSTAKQSSTATH